MTALSIEAEAGNAEPLPLARLRATVDQLRQRLYWLEAAIETRKRLREDLEASVCSAEGQALIGELDAEITALERRSAGLYRVAARAGIRLEAR